MTPHGLWTVLTRAVAGWWNDNVPHLGAALSYYTLFSLAPILVVAISIGGLVFGAEAVRGEIVGQIDGLVGHDGAVAVQAMLEGAAKPSSSVPATIIGIITFFLGATGAFLELQTALNAIWRVKPKASTSFLRSLLVDRLISFGLVVGVGFLMLTSLLVSAGLAALHTYMGETFPGGAVLWEAVNVTVSLGVISILFATVSEIVARDKCSLDIFWLKDNSLEDSSKLPDPHLLAAEIAEDLRSALDQIDSILGDLQQRSSSNAAAAERPAAD